MHFYYVFTLAINHPLKNQHVSVSIIDKVSSFVVVELFTIDE